MRHCFNILVFTLITFPVLAGTIIDIEAPGLATRLLMDERYARVDNAADGSYLLLDRGDGTSYLVLPGKRKVMALDAAVELEERPVQLVPTRQTGARIIGYPVQRYQLYAGNKYCGDVFASAQALDQLDVGPMLDAVSRLIDQQLHAMGPYVAIIDDCTQASMRVLNHSDSIGMPLRVHDAGGDLLSNITEIDTDADIAEGLLAYPADFTLVDSVKELSSTGHLLESARQYSPELDNTYRAVERFVKPYRDWYVR